MPEEPSRQQEEPFAFERYLTPKKCLTGVIDRPLVSSAPAAGPTADRLNFAHGFQDILNIEILIHRLSAGLPTP
jgi:hypothetical protein